MKCKSGSINTVRVAFFVIETWK